MPAVVRVKRRIDEEPLSAFVLNGKRRRLEEDTSSTLSNKDELSTLLKFAGTMKEQDDTAATQFARLSKEEAKELVMRKTRKPVNATDKARQEIRQCQQEQRFRVVNCLRTTLAEGNEDEKEITIVDIEKHSANEKTVDIPKSFTDTTSLNTNLSQASTSAAAAAAAAINIPTDSDTGYVYDLYIPDNEQQADNVDLMDDNYLSIRAFDDIIYEDVYNNDDDDEYDSEDSNQENYFANEYPDEYDDAVWNCDGDDNSEEYVDNMRQDLENFMFGDDDEESENSDDASSSEDDGFYNTYSDPYVHSINIQDESFCDDVDSFDVERYGPAYARYKARLLNKLNTYDVKESEEDASNSSYKSGTDAEDDEYYQTGNESDD